MSGVGKKQKSGQPIPPESYRVRSYREQAGPSALHRFRVICQETDLFIQADQELKRLSHELVVAARAHIEGYIDRHPAFATALQPWPDGGMAPAIVRTMIQTARLAGVGPMAAIAGAIAESVGKGLLEHCQQVIVENGGDIFLRTEKPVVAALFAGSSPLSMNVGVRISKVREDVGLCTSSATVGHSLSTGIADAVCVLSPSCPLADAVATSIGNRIKDSDGIQQAIDFGSRIEGVAGILVVAGGQIGAWGNVELVSFKGKKG
jgi:ApbE superfamily uncharacterized protein (UPF0280 family)